MPDGYGYSSAAGIPHAKKQKKQITINLDSTVIDYFKDQANLTGIPYQTLINLYLADCVENRKKLDLSWK